jgi:hypothetical protein
MNAVAYITTRNHETDAAYLNAQGLRVTIETEPDGTPFLALTAPNGVKRYLNPGDALIWNPNHKPISATVVPEPLVTALTAHISSLISAATKKHRR